VKFKYWRLFVPTGEVVEDEVEVEAGIGQDKDLPVNQTASIIGAIYHIRFLMKLAEWNRQSDLGTGNWRYYDRPVGEWTIKRLKGDLWE